MFISLKEEENLRFHQQRLREEGLERVFIEKNLLNYLLLVEVRFESFAFEIYRILWCVELKKKMEMLRRNT